MSILKSVVITLPKGFSETKGVSACDLVGSAPKLKFTTSLLAENARSPARKMSTYTEDSDDASSIGPDVCVRGKKRRLDHLTWEEKLQRKKLKNRVAAQTSRDRKKAKLDDLEDTVRMLREKSDRLVQECAMLKSQNETLVAENKELRREMSSRTTREEQCSSCQSRVSCAASSLGSAASPRYPLPQGGAAQLAPALTLTPQAATLWRILTLYLLSRNCLATSKETTTSKDLKNLRKVFCEKLPLKWKQILMDQANKSRLRTIPSKNLMIRQEWWGRHQKMWKPVEPAEA